MPDISIKQLNVPRGIIVHYRKCPINSQRQADRIVERTLRECLLFALKPIRRDNIIRLSPLGMSFNLQGTKEHRDSRTVMRSEMRLLLSLLSMKISTIVPPISLFNLHI